MSSPPQVSDRGRLYVLVLGFGTALGVTAFAYPLLALGAGLSPSMVGILAAVSAGVQMLSRLVLPALLARFKDRSLMIFSFLVLSGSAGTLIATRAVAGFVTAQACQGLARGLFHTASQTHAVRDEGVASRRLALIQTTAQFGRFLGPGLGGVLAIVSLEASLWSAVALTGVGALLGVSLLPKAPYARAPASERAPIWRRPELGAASWGGAASGVWRGLSESFVPVILTDRGLSASMIGWLLSGADASGFLTTAAVAKFGREDVRPFVPVSVLSLAGAVAVLPLVSGVLLLGGAMIVAGSAGGVSGVLGTAVANAAVEESEQGAAITLVGTYRAAARLTAPAGVSGLLAIATLPVAVAVIAAMIAAPGPWLAVGARAGRPRSV
jgi:MFS family permease